MSRALLESADWDNLDLETQAVGLTLGPQEKTRPWHEQLASQQPARALELALWASRYSLRFARLGNAITRVLEVTGPTTTAALPSAEFWRELRRTTWESAQLREGVRAVARKHAPTDLRLRAGLAYALPDDAEWWSAADRATALRETDPDTGALLLLALLRHEATSLRHVVWPPPVHTLKGLDPDELMAAHRWCPRSAPGLRQRNVSPQAIGAAFRRASQRDSLALLGALLPTKELVRRLRKAPPRAGAMQQLVQRSLIAAWERALQGRALLPPLQLHDGRTLAGAHELARLRGALRSHHEPSLDDFARRATPESLGEFAEHLFVQWLLDDAPPTGHWALDATGRFPTDASADAVAEFALRRRHYVDLGRAVPRGIGRGPEVLARMGTRQALRRLAELSRAPECRAERQAITTLFASAAATQALSAYELEDRLFPQLTLPPGATVRLGPGLRVGLKRDGKVLPLPPEWASAAADLPATVRRLERLMCEGSPLSAIAFTETWGMHPLLSAVARGLVWGVFSGEARVDLLVPGRSSPTVLDDSMGLRPLHPLELTPVEREDFGSWRVGQQPFPQLERPCFKQNDLREQDFSPDEFSRLRQSIELAGWERDPGADTWVRTGDGWSARIAFRDFVMGGELRVVQSDFSIQGAPPARVVSELHRELTVGAEAANQCFQRVTAYLV